MSMQGQVALRRRIDCLSRACLGLVMFGSMIVSHPAAGDLEALERVPLPAGAEREIVALDLLQNGRRVSIASLDLPGSLEDSLAFYREAWADTVADWPGFIERSVGDWHLISRLERNENQVVQLRDGENGLEALVSVLALVRPMSIPDSYPLPDGAETVSSTSSADEGIGQATTTVVQARQGAGETVAFYRDRLRRDGWSKVSEQVHTKASVFLLKRGDVRLELVVTDARGGGSLAVFNRLEGS